MVASVTPACFLRTDVASEGAAVDVGETERSQCRTGRLVVRLVAGLGSRLDRSISDEPLNGFSIDVAGSLIAGLGPVLVHQPQQERQRF